MDLFKKLTKIFPSSKKTAPQSARASIATYHLQYAVHSGDLDHAQHWIDQGARANKKMLYYAVGTKHYGMAKLLLEQNIPATNDLMVEAYRQKNANMMLLLEKNGASIDRKDKKMRNFLKIHKKNLRQNKPKSLPSAPVYPAG